MHHLPWFRIELDRCSTSSSTDIRRKRNASFSSMNNSAMATHAACHSNSHVPLWLIVLASWKWSAECCSESSRMFEKLQPFLHQQITVSHLQSVSCGISAGACLLPLLTMTLPKGFTICSCGSLFTQPVRDHLYVLRRILCCRREGHYCKFPFAYLYDLALTFTYYRHGRWSVWGKPDTRKTTSWSATFFFGFKYIPAWRFADLYQLPSPRSSEYGKRLRLNSLYQNISRFNH